MKTGVSLPTEIFGQPIPKIPSNQDNKKLVPDSAVATAKVTFLMTEPPKVT